MILFAHGFLLLNFTFMITQERKDFIIQTLENQRKWVDDNSKLIDEKCDHGYYDFDIKTVPIRLIPIIDEDVLISFANWDAVIKENGWRNIDRYSPDDLVDWFISFQTSMEYLWFDENWPSDKLIKRWKYYCWRFQDSFFRADTPNIEEIFLDAFSSYILWD